MGYGICRVQKVKAAAVGSMQYHNDRLPGEHSNPNIDHSKRGDNAEFIKHGSYRAEVNDRIERFRKSDRKVRKAAFESMYSSYGQFANTIAASPEFFEGKSRDEVMAFFRDGFDFVKSEVGEGNMVHFTVHMDESTPHAHFGFTPIKDGTLSWKNYFDGRDALRGWQDRFFEKVSKPWGLERGEKDTGRTHKDAAQMRRDKSRSWTSGRSVFGKKSKRWKPLLQASQKASERSGRLETMEAEKKDLEATLKALEATLKALEAKLTTSKARLQSLTDEQTRLSEACRDFEQGAQALESDLKLLGQRW